MRAPPQKATGQRPGPPARTAGPPTAGGGVTWTGRRRLKFDGTTLAGGLVLPKTGAEALQSPRGGAPSKGSSCSARRASVRQHSGPRCGGGVLCRRRGEGSGAPADAASFSWRRPVRVFSESWSGWRHFAGPDGQPSAINEPAWTAQSFRAGRAGCAWHTIRTWG
jgi:hypothetical protein